MRSARQDRAEQDVLDAEIASWRATSRARLHGSLMLASMALTLALFVGSRAEWLEAWVRGELDLAGNPRFEPAFPVDRDAIARIDFERLHARAIPDWITRVSHAQTPRARQRAEGAWYELRTAIAPDPNLVAIWEEVHLHLSEAPLARARRIDWLLWAHDQYVDRVGQPYRLEASMHVRGRRAIIATLGYRVLADLRTEQGARVRVLKRVDRTGIVEGWLGHTARDEDGAIVVSDRALQFAVRSVWPGLHPALDGRRPMDERGLLPGVREEAEAALSPEHFALLEESAADEQILIEVAASIRERHACGSGFAVFELPYEGLSISSHRALREALWAGRESSCPDITLDEAAQLVGASERLRTTDGLGPALEALAAWVARSVAVHELRHVVDGAIDGFACSGCVEGTPALVRDELSAYLATFATPGVGYVAALQACAMPAGTPGEHALAIQMATGAVIPGGCPGDAGLGFYARARAAERRYFGERAAGGPPIGFPATLAVLRRLRPALADGTRAR